MSVKEDAESAADAVLEEAAQLLEAMAQELRRRKQKPKKKKKERPIREGDRILMVRPKDPHLGRRGEVLKRRGTMYWDLRLDADGARGECLLYRMDSSLKVVGPP